MLQLTKNLKANPPGSLPVPGVASATPAHAGRRPGSEDAGRRARAGRGLGGADGGGVRPAGARLRISSFLLGAGRRESRDSNDLSKHHLAYLDVCFEVLAHSSSHLISTTYFRS